MNPWQECKSPIEFVRQFQTFAGDLSRGPEAVRKLESIGGHRIHDAYFYTAGEHVAHLLLEVGMDGSPVYTFLEAVRAHYGAREDWRIYGQEGPPNLGLAFMRMRPTLELFAKAAHRARREAWRQPEREESHDATLVESGAASSIANAEDDDWSVIELKIKGYLDSHLEGGDDSMIAQAIDEKRATIRSAFRVEPPRRLARHGYGKRTPNVDGRYHAPPQ